MGKYSRLGNDLYGGSRSINFIGRRALWYSISLLLVGLAIAVVMIRGLNFGIEFTGGIQYTVNLSSEQITQENADKLREAVGSAGVEGAGSPQVTTAGQALLVQTEDLSMEGSDQIVEVIGATVDVARDSDISQTEIGASWGKEVGQRAITGVVVFLILVMLFIGFYFREWKMSIAALVALFHDIAITVGIYALSGFTVSPSAVTGLLAILGFSLYDTVVVFDKVRENTHELRKSDQSYADAANLAVNQTLVRSINTGIVALIPIGAILFTSAVLLGASSLQDLALSQFVGMAAGVYSSVMIAPRVLVQLKSGEDEVKRQDRRAKARAKAQADRYASVPAFTEDLPVRDAPDDLEFEDEIELDDPDAPVAPTPGGSRPEAVGRGRTAPTPHRPVGDSPAAGRQQPTRQPKSQRKKP